MNTKYVEEQYPVAFRKELSELVGKHLLNQHSIELTGMKRVGISNFLKFFINHQGIDKTYIKGQVPRFFITVDLDDLVEREMFAFWRLTYKRVVDSVMDSRMSEAAKQKVSDEFSISIQTDEILMTIDGIKSALGMVSDFGAFPVLFLVRFDRLQDTMTPELFDNLRGLVSATAGRLSYVFTSFRSLSDVNPDVFPKSAMTVFSHPVYIGPASHIDMKIVLHKLIQQYKCKLTPEVKREIIQNAGGHVQYLQLSIIKLNEIREKTGIDKDGVFELINSDERVRLLSEELFDHLKKGEKKVLQKVIEKGQVNIADKKRAMYLWDSGILDDMNKVFSRYFENFLQIMVSNGGKGKKLQVLTKKEHLLFTLLQDCDGGICERERIIKVVWSECKPYGVSDWSIDRLVSRLRKKLIAQDSKFEIETIRTRGFKLVE